MFVTGVVALFTGYSFLYTGIINLLNGGKGPTLFEAMGFTKPLESPASRSAQGSSNQTGQPPTYNVSTNNAQQGPVIPT